MESVFPWLLLSETFQSILKLAFEKQANKQTDRSLKVCQHWWIA